MDNMELTKNISKSTEHTKKIINELWSNATALEKQSVVKLGGYCDTRSVYYTRKTGRISNKMAVAFSRVFNITIDEIIGSRPEQGIIYSIEVKEDILPSNEESLKQYELLLNLKEFTKDNSKKEAIDKVKLLIQQLL